MHLTFVININSQWLVQGCSVSRVCAFMSDKHKKTKTNKQIQKTGALNKSPTHGTCAIFSRVEVHFVHVGLINIRKRVLIKYLVNIPCCKKDTYFIKINKWKAKIALSSL